MCISDSPAPGSPSSVSGMSNEGPVASRALTVDGAQAAMHASRRKQAGFFMESGDLQEVNLNHAAPGPTGAKCLSHLSRKHQHRSHCIPGGSITPLAGESALVVPPRRVESCEGFLEFLQFGVP